MKKILFLLIVSTNVIFAGVTYLYKSKTARMNYSTVHINDSKHSYAAGILDNGKLEFMIGNSVGNGSFKPFDGWNPGKWTGLKNAISDKWGYAKSSNSAVSYGATVIHTKGTGVGMFLNSFVHKPVDPGTAGVQSLQHFVGWKGRGHNIWNSRPNDSLVIEMDANIYHSYTRGGITQALVTLIFGIKNAPKGRKGEFSLFYNFFMFDSRKSLTKRDYIIEDKADVGWPIIQCNSKSKYNEKDKYGTGIKGKKTQATTRRRPLKKFRHYGLTITKEQMKRAIHELKYSKKWAAYRKKALQSKNWKYDITKNLDISQLRLKRVIPSLEISTKSGNGQIGVSYRNLNVYMKSKGSSSGTPKRPTHLVVYAKYNTSLKIKFKDDSTNESKFQVVYYNYRTRRWYRKFINRKLGRGSYYYHLTGLTQNTKYKIYVRAYNGKYSQYSNPAYSRTSKGSSSRQKKYEFNRNRNSEGWRYNHLNQLYSGPYRGAWYFTAKQNDPMLISPNLNLNSLHNKKVTIRMANNGTSARYSKMQIFWQTKREKYFSESKSKIINISNHGGWSTYTINLGHDKITRIRIDPLIRGDGHGIGIDYIRFSQ